MMKRIVLSALLTAASIGAASAQAPQCTVPNTLANGQVADATEVMDNFNAVAACAEEAVTADGAPQTGEIAVMTGSQSITGGDLSGDVTTSGGTATTLSTTGVVSGDYINPTITVDAKGRITAATNGLAGGPGGGGGSQWTELVLANPDAETGDTSGWTMYGGGFSASTANTPSGHAFIPIYGTYSFVASSNSHPTMVQDYGVGTFATDIDAGVMSAMVEGFAVDTYSTGELPYIYVVFLDATGADIAYAVSPTQALSFGQGRWRHISAQSRIPPQTRTLRVVAYARRNSGSVNNVAFDAIRLFIR